MLLLSFSLGSEHYAIRTDIILEIIPLIPVDHVPHMDASICGIIHYRGQTIPVIDLSMYFNQQYSKHCLSSRIIVCQIHIKKKDFVIGLTAEHVTETFQCDEDSLESNSISNQSTHFLGRICRHQNKNIQLINTENLLPEHIQEQLVIAAD